MKDGNHANSRAIVTAGKLSQEERENQLQPLLEKGWNNPAAWDALIKDFQFKDFN